MLIMRVSAIQMDMKFADPAYNFKHAEELIREAAASKPDVIVLPETWNTGFFPKENLKELSDKDGAAVKDMCSALARELNVNIVAGSVSNVKNDKVYNTAYVFDRQGACIAEYDKTHLFTPMGEHDYYEAGTHVTTFELDGKKCGIIICYDVRFLELVRTLALTGLDVLFVPAQWPALRKYHWDTLTAAVRSKTRCSSSPATPAVRRVRPCTAAPLTFSIPGAIRSLPPAAARSFSPATLISPSLRASALRSTFIATAAPSFTTSDFRIAFHQKSAIAKNIKEDIILDSKITFTLHADGKSTEKTIVYNQLLAIGYAGRNIAKTMEHIKELEEQLGVPAPKKIPTIFQMSNMLLTQDPDIDFVGNNTCGEVEYIIITQGDEIYIGLGSDHTDRKLESASVPKAKQVCPKPIGHDIWKYDDLKDHWDSIKLNSYQTVDGKEIPYQQGTLADILPVEHLLKELRERIGDGFALCHLLRVLSPF